MPPTSLTQVQRTELGYIEAIPLVHITLASNTLYLSTRDYIYNYTAGTQAYDGYIINIQGLGETTAIDGGVLNSQVRLTLANEQYKAYAKLILLNSADPFFRAQVDFYEVRQVQSEEVFTSDVKVLLHSLTIHRIENITAESFELVCLSKLETNRNMLGLLKVTTARYPKADPNDIGKISNVLYGSLEKVPARCVYTGVIDFLRSDITAAQTTFYLSNSSRVYFTGATDTQPVSSVVTIGIDNERITGTYNRTTHVFTATQRGAAGTTATKHGQNTPVAEILSKFIYELSDHPLVSIGDVYVDDIHQITQGALVVSKYTGQTGSQHPDFPNKGIIQFNTNMAIDKATRVMDEHTHTTATGSHAHDTSNNTITTQEVRATTAYGSATTPSVLCQNPNAILSYNPGNPNDDRCIIQALGTGMSAYVTAANFNPTIPSGATLRGITFHFELSCDGSNDPNINCYVDVNGVRAWSNGGNAVGRSTFDYGINTSNWYPSVTFHMQGKTYPYPGFWIGASIFGVSATYKYVQGLAITASPATGVATSISNSSVLAGQTTADLVIGTEVSANCVGYKDTSGSYGGAGTTIQRPDYVIKHLLCARGGNSLTTIGTSFTSSGTQFASASAGGYKFAFLLHDIGTTVKDILVQLAKQCRSVFYEWAGKYELAFLLDTVTTADTFVLDDWDFVSPPIHSFTGSETVRNKLFAYYKRVYQGSFGRANQDDGWINPDAIGRGFQDALTVKYGAADLVDDLLLPAVREKTTATDVANYWLYFDQLPKRMVELTLKWRAIQLNPGQFFSYTDNTFGWAGYLLLEFKPDYANGVIQIKGIEAPIAQIVKTVQTSTTLNTTVSPVMKLAKTATTSVNPGISVGHLIYSASQAFEDSGTELIPLNNAAPTGWFEVIADDIVPRTAVSGTDGIFELDADSNIERKTTASNRYMPKAANEGGLGSAALYFNNVYMNEMVVNDTHFVTEYVATTDDTETVLHSMAISSGSTMLLNAQIVGVYSTGTKACAFRRTAYVKRADDGTVAVLAQQSVGADLTDDALLQTRFIENTSTVDLVVKGLTGATTKWACIIYCREL